MVCEAPFPSFAHVHGTGTERERFMKRPDATHFPKEREVGLDIIASNGRIWIRISPVPHSDGSTLLWTAESLAEAARVPN